MPAVSRTATCCALSANQLNLHLLVDAISERRSRKKKARHSPPHSAWSAEDDMLSDAKLVSSSWIDTGDLRSGGLPRRLIPLRGMRACGCSEGNVWPHEVTNSHPCCGYGGTTDRVVRAEAFLEAREDEVRYVLDLGFD